ncbi:MAG: hypothetical protein ACR2HX_05030 [Pyrinomonadaceae bacterium]
MKLPAFVTCAKFAIFLENAQRFVVQFVHPTAGNNRQDAMLANQEKIVGTNKSNGAIPTVW